MNANLRPLTEWYQPIRINDAVYFYDLEAQSFYQEFLGEKFTVSPEEIRQTLERYLAHVQKVCAPDWTPPSEQ